MRVIYPRLLAAALLLSTAVIPSSAASDKVRAKRLLEHAEEMYLNGDFKKALSEVSDSISENSSVMAAYALRSRIWNVLGDQPAMLKDADRVVSKLGASLSLLDTEERVAYGTALLAQGRTSHALTTFNAALEIDKDDAESLAGRARVFHAIGQNHEALTDLNRVLKQSERKRPLYYYMRATAYYDLGDLDHAIDDLTSALRLNKQFYAAYGLVGATLARKGDHKRALAAYNKALSLNPEYGYAYLGRAAIRLAQGVDEAAFGDFEEAVRVDAHSYAPYYNRAEAYFRRGNREEALNDYRKAINSFQLDADFAIKIGDRLCQFLLWKEGIDAYTRAYVLAGGEADRLSPLVNPSAVRNSPWTKAKKDAPIAAGTPTVQKPKVVLSPAGVAALIHRARAYEGLKDPKRAMADLTEAIERDPSSASAWAARGMLQLRNGMEDEPALADLNQAVRLEPKTPEVRNARGSYYARTDKPKLALEDFNAALDADPDYPEAYNSRGALYANALNEPDKALSDIEKAVQLKPEDSGYRYNLGMMRLRQREFGRAVEAFNKALELKGPPARILAARADAYSLLGDHAAAFQDVQLALEKDPKFAGAYDVLGSMRLRAHDYEQAVRDLNQALQLDPDHVWARIHRGRALGALGSMRAAVKDFKKAVEADPHSKDAWTNLCQAKRMMKDPGGAVSDCTRAIEIDSFHSPAYIQRGLAYLAMREADKVLDDMGSAVALGVRSAEAHLAMGVAHAATRQYRDAHRDFEAALQIDPGVRSTQVGFAPSRDNGEDYFNAIADLDELTRGDTNQAYFFMMRGDAYLNAEHYDKAIQEYTKAMELDATNADAYVMRGVTLQSQDALDAAQQDYLRAIELAPNESSIHVRLATLLTLKRNYAGAQGEIKKGLKLDSKNAEAYLRAGNVYYFQRDYQKALDSYLLSAKLDPLNAAAHNGVGLGYFALKKHQLALEHFSRAIALNPRVDRYFRNRASTFTNMRSFNNATAEFKSASYLNTDPNLVEEYKKLIDESEARSATSKS